MFISSVATKNGRKFYIDGSWVDPIGRAKWEVVNPATEDPIAEIALGSAADVDRAVAAARAAFPAFARTSRKERLDLLKRIHDAYMARYDEFANTISLEMGAPMRLCLDLQALAGVAHIGEMMRVLETFEFETRRGTTMLVREPVGVVGAITPWNWPINQLVLKVAPAIAAGCTIVLKPSEIAPLSALLFAEVMNEAGVPRGVFNLVNGDGATVGQALAAHPDIDMISITGSVRAGIAVAKAAATSVKRVHQELGGKSANILLDDVDLEAAVTAGVATGYLNGGQTCNAPTRMLVPAKLHDRAAQIAKTAAESFKLGSPTDLATTLGPMASLSHFNKVQGLIADGIAEGARLVTGGTGRPDGINRGYYVRPTVFANVEPGMRIAREEIFGPVLSIMSYGSDDEAVAMANDTPFGLAAYVQSKDLDRARGIAARMRAGTVYVNYPGLDLAAPFGGYKQSGNGREYGEWGLDAFLELKGVVGYGAAA
jgi:aldehyde dehydrogenase (NAD+)